MPIQSKILFFIICFSIKLYAIPIPPDYDLITQPQLDSLIEEKNIDNDMTQLELLVLYENAWKKKHRDSIKIFKKLALLNSDLEQPKDAYFFTEKYIRNTLDFSILRDNSYETINNTEEFKILNDKYLPKFNFLTFLYLYVSLIGFFFMVIINFSKKSSAFSKLTIAGFVGVHSLFILEFVLYMSNFQYKYPHTYLMASTVALIYGPLLYFYYKSIVENYTLKKHDLLHLLPNIILLISLVPLYKSSSSEKIKMMLGITDFSRDYITIIFISKIVSLIVYGFLIGRLQQRKSKNIYKNDSNKSIFRWVKTIYRIHLIYIISYLIYAISAAGVLGEYSSFTYHAQVGIMSAMIVYVAYMAYVQPDVFNKKFVSTPDGLFFEKYKKSGLTKAFANELKESLVNLLIEEKIYKENNISLEKLSNRLNTTRHNTSQIINEHFNMNFFELINKSRINEATNMLKEDVHGNLNIIEIAYEVGYNNKVTFNKAFKKETSMTPSEYIDSQFKNSTLK